MPDDEDRDRPVPGRVCYCLQINEEEIEQAIRVLGLKTIEEVAHYTRAGAACHTCWPDIEALLERCARGEYRYDLTMEDAERIKAEAARR